MHNRVDWRDQCRVCQGKGHKTVISNRTESDPSMSLLMGVATGIGYLPMTKQVRHEKKEPCRYCNGTGLFRGGRP